MKGEPFIMLTVNTIAAAAIVLVSIASAVGRARAFQQVAKLQHDLHLTLAIVREWLDCEVSPTPELHARLQPFFEQYETELPQYGFKENRSHPV